MNTRAQTFLRWALPVIGGVALVTRTRIPALLCLPDTAAKTLSRDPLTALLQDLFGDRIELSSKHPTI